MRFQRIMPSLTIPFPEGTRTIGLRGKRITIGRLPDNTVQIRDRTISAYHAELIEDGDHYRLQDKGSTNGVVINGQRVTDFHLREDCKVNIGGATCEFTASSPAERLDEIDSIPTRSEMQTILQANADLRAEIAALHSQVETMTKARETSGDSGPTVPLAQHDQLAQELAALRNTLQERQTQIDRLTSLHSIAVREKEVLQKGYDDACSALDKARERAPVATTAPVVKAAAPVAKFAPAPSNGVAANRPTERLTPDLAGAAPQQGANPAPSAPPGGAPKAPTVAPTTATVPKVPTAPAAPAVAPKPSPVAAPASGIVPRPAVVPGAPKPPSATPAVAATERPATPGAPTAPQPATAGGMKILPKPPGSLGTASGAGSPVRRPASGLQPAKPAPATALAAASTGPKGTQKLVE